MDNKNTILVLWILAMWPASMFTFLDQEIPNALLISPLFLVMGSYYRFPIEFIIALLLGIASIAIAPSQGIVLSSILALFLTIIPLSAYHFGRASPKPAEFLEQMGKSAALVGALSGLLLICTTLLIGIPPRSQGVETVFANGLIPPNLYAAKGVNTSATILSFILMISITYLLDKSKKLSSLKVLVYVGNFLLFIYIYMLSSRQALVGIIVFFVLTLVNRRAYKTASLIVILLSVFLYTNYVMGHNFSSHLDGGRIVYLLEEITTDRRDLNSLSSNRVNLFLHAYDLFIQNPFFGLGFDSLAFKESANYNSSAHNYYITTFMKGGIFFGLYMMYILAKIGRSSTGVHANRNGNNKWMPFIFSAFVQALFWDIFLLPIASGMFFAIGGAMIARSELNKNRLISGQ